MHVFQAPEYLIYDVLFMYFLQDICPDYSVEIGLHEFKY